MLGYSGRCEQNKSNTAAERFWERLTGNSRDASQRIPARTNTLVLSAVPGGIACGAVGLSRHALEGYV